jgi:tetratricopeptide (TPR) repeat protein
MNDQVETEQSTKSLAQRADNNSEILNIIDLSVRYLSAEQSDIEHLLSDARAKAVSIQQLSGLLRLSHERLQTLRPLVSDLVKITAGDVELVESGQQLYDAVQTGDSLSLDVAMQALDKIHSQTIAKTGQSEFIARIRGIQGLIAATRHEYQTSAVYYAEAAATPGLGTEMQWHYQKERASALLDLGREFANVEALQQAVSLLDNEVLELAPGAQHPGSRTVTMQLLGNALGILGNRQGGTRNLENAISVFEETLAELDQQHSPIEWSEAQNSLGNALGILGHRLGDEDMLTKSVAAFENALEERTRWRAPREWASTQNNLAAILQSQGQRKKDPRTLKRSVEAYKDVLEVWTKELMPLEWATTMDNLGTALRLLGEHRKGPRTLEQSVAAYNSALSIRNREQLPREWALTQNNLGAALQKLAERTQNPEILGEAVSAYENTLKEWTRDHMPMAWAMTMANLGVARRTLAEITEDVQTARKAVGELEAVSDMFRHASHAQYSELSIDQLAQAQKLVDTLSKT